MPELKFIKSEFEELIDNLIPGYQKSMVLDALDIESDKETEFDNIGLFLTGEKNDSSFIYTTGPSAKAKQSMWSHIKFEVYDYLCTTSKKYSKERSEAGNTVKSIITIIATAIASHFNIAVGVITGALTIALLSALKIGKNAWCEANRPDK